ncbi:hypothetical protein SAMN04490194_0597 [Pseudomonas migulae]|uniref:DUF4234 domain-containing protein n=2 Tax=Pseudomonas migulae TaxID=78543 RepID=A0A1H5B9G6_9PSED|nr:hypothetical protein SAMN04490194_0597 [Pseudomonas migulae]
MHSDPYAPPTADCSVGDDLLSAFFVISKRKLAILFIATSGFYVLYWLYRNWHRYRSATATKVIPLIRALMGVWFVYSLFRTVDRRIFAMGHRYKWYPRFLALAFILFSALQSARVWLLDLHLGFAMLIALLALQVSCLMRMQEAVNHLADDISARQNSTLTPMNWLWIVLGLCWWGILADAVFTGIAGREPGSP